MGHDDAAHARGGSDSFIYVRGASLKIQSTQPLTLLLQIHIARLMATRPTI
jgi:hypothetical protein